VRSRLGLSALIGCLAAPAIGETNAECVFQMGGKDVLVGPCVGSDREPTKAFAIASPDGAIAARIVTKGGGVGEAYWNGGIQGQEAEILIGTVVLIGACWASDKAKLCMTR
jgi:hypothetical protein